MKEADRMATRNLVPLKLIVGLDPVTGFADYPNFNLISSETRKGMDWSKFLDVHGGGMHYDKTCGHKSEDVDSPFGTQICCICVPQNFATEALNLFPDTVKELTPVEFETFYDTKAHAHEPDETIDDQALNGLNAQRTLKVAVGQDVTALDARIVKALDPLDLTEAGVKKNDKLWTAVKAKQGIEISANVKL